MSQRIVGWDNLVKTTGYSRPVIEIWLKLRGFPKPVGIVETGKRGNQPYAWCKEAVTQWMETNKK